MKPVFKCEYCDYIGIEKDVKEHEPKCTENYTRRSCYTCKHRGYTSLSFTCACGREIPEGKIYEFCPKYERETNPSDPLDDFMSLMLGGKR